MWGDEHFEDNNDGCKENEESQSWHIWESKRKPAWPQPSSTASKRRKKSVAGIHCAAGGLCQALDSVVPGPSTVTSLHVVMSSGVFVLKLLDSPPPQHLLQSSFPISTCRVLPGAWGRFKKVDWKKELACRQNYHFFLVRKTLVGTSVSNLCL